MMAIDEKDLRRAAERAGARNKARRERLIRRVRRAIGLGRDLLNNADDDKLWGTIERATRWGGKHKPGPIGNALFALCAMPVYIARDTQSVQSPDDPTQRLQGYEAEAQIRQLVLRHRGGEIQRIPIEYIKLDTHGDGDAGKAHLLSVCEPEPENARRKLGWTLNDLEKWLAEYEADPGTRPWGTPEPRLKIADGVSVSLDWKTAEFEAGRHTPEHTLAILLDRLDRFLARLDSLDRTADGSYLVRESSANRVRGAWMLWERVQTAATWVAGSIVHTEPTKGNPIGTGHPRPDLIPLEEASRALMFALVKKGRDTWPATIPAEKVKKIRALRKELALWVDAVPAGAIERTAALKSAGAELLVADEHRGLNTPRGNAPPRKEDLPPLRPGHYESLRVMQQHPFDAWLVTKVTDGRNDSTNRESTGQILRDLLAHKLVERLGPRKGYKLTESGRKYQIPDDRLPDVP